MAERVARATADQIQAAARAIVESSYPIALTGAGMSVESGIPPFRGPGGLWTKYGEPPMNGYQIFLADPKKAWEDRIRRQNDELWGPLKVAKPNPGHLALAELEEIGVLRFLITQNVDDSSDASNAARASSPRKSGWRYCRRPVRVAATACSRATRSHSANRFHPTYSGNVSITRREPMWCFVPEHRRPSIQRLDLQSRSSSVAAR